MTYAQDERHLRGVHDYVGMEPPTTYQQNWQIRTDKADGKLIDLGPTTSRAIKTPATPVCFTYVFGDGAWGHEAFWAIDRWGTDWLGAAIEGVAQDLIETGPDEWGIAAVAVRMSDGSLVIVRPKVRP